MELVSKAHQKAGGHMLVHGRRPIPMWLGVMIACLNGLVALFMWPLTQLINALMGGRDALYRNGITSKKKEIALSCAAILAFLGTVVCGRLWWIGDANYTEIAICVLCAVLYFETTFFRYHPENPPRRPTYGYGRSNEDGDNAREWILFILVTVAIVVPFYWAFLLYEYFFGRPDAMHTRHDARRELVWGLTGGALFCGMIASLVLTFTWDKWSWLALVPLLALYIKGIEQTLFRDD